MALTDANLKAISTGFKALFGETFNETYSLATNLATRVNSNDLQEKYPWIGNIPGMIEWTGSRTVNQLADFGYTLANKRWESTVEVPKDYIKYDKASIFAPAIKMMAQNAKKHSDNLLLDLLLNGGTNLCYDGKAFFADDHPVGAGTFDNTANFALDTTNLLAAYSHMMSVKNDDGKAMGVRPNKLIVGPALLSTVKTVIDADRQADGSANPTYKLVEYEVHPEITDSSWYLLDTTKAIRPFIVQVAEEGELEENYDALFMDNKIYYGTTSFMNAGYSLWQLAFMSTGTGAAATGDI